MTLLYSLAPLVTDPDRDWGPWWGHGGGWWWIGGPLMFLLWIGLIALVVWFIVQRGPGRAPERAGVDRAKDILAERYARGEITTEEYWERLDQLK